MTNDEIELNEATQSLLNAVNDLFPGNVSVQFIGQLQSGYVRHDQSQQVQSGKDLMVQIADLSAPNYTASHELLHLLMVLRGFPQVFFSLTTGNEQLDQQLMFMGTELYDIVCHFVVVDEQRKHGLINDEVEAMYLKGIKHTIKPEPEPLDDEMTLRLLTLLDAMVFYGDRFDEVKPELERDYPVALAAAEKLYQLISEKKIDSPFTLRRNVVKLFKAFDDQLTEWHLPALHNPEFTTITSVLSERQLRLKVRQVFELFHSDLHDQKTGRRAYVGFNKGDNQNSFVISAPKPGDDTPDYYKGIYELTVEELFKQLEMPYILR
ncbi:IpaB/EvcA family protein [Levilactobacillus bambusae]|uniref:IpaB/EvcA family protein n=1 Tax=Levilactobacillus bambusae TaxID=2024736 RepID=A0A2V1MXR9_9LACO|nr:IpaB/EvcA family protein [Levilactobacillus bambusae]PWF99337.1 IpaB/EvcA family protein [Levilactobacillus bambusae]